jgi:hypothetical protein
MIESSCKRAIRVSSKQSNFFSVRTKTNRNSICFGCFSVCFAKPKNIFLVCFGVSDRYRNNQNIQNTVETNRKNLHKTFSIRGSWNRLICFLGSNRNKPKLNLFRLFFGLLFRETKRIFFWFVSVCFDVSDRYQNNQNKQNLWYGELKMLIF